MAAFAPHPTPASVAPAAAPDGVSVVIPAYESEAFVARAVRSALAQRDPAPLEVLVVDDGSRDATSARAREAGADVLRLDPNGGVSAARNAGLARARGAWVAFLDADDAFLPGHLGELWRHREGHVLVAGGALELGSEGAVRRQGALRAVEAASPADVMVPENLVVTSSVLVHRDTALACGGFDAGLRMAEDLDLWVRMIERGPARVTTRVTVLRHVHVGQATADPEEMQATRRALVDRYAGRPWFSARVAGGMRAATAWDDLRTALRLRDAPQAAATLGELASPAAAAGLLALLARRARIRRSSRRFAALAGTTATPGPAA